MAALVGPLPLGCAPNAPELRYVLAAHHVFMGMQVGFALSFDDVPPGPALERDRAEWDVLVRGHQRTVVVALLARGIPLDQAKDLAQAAWTRLWSRRATRSIGASQLAGRASELPSAHAGIAGLVIQQALFLAADERRRKAEVIGGELREDPSPFSTEARLLSRDQLRRMSRKLSDAPKSARRVFELVHGDEGLSHSEVAERVGLSLQRVRQILCELRAVLRPLLSEPE